MGLSSSILHFIAHPLSSSQHGGQDKNPEMFGNPRDDRHDHLNSQRQRFNCLRINPHGTTSPSVCLLSRAGEPTRQPLRPSSYSRTLSITRTSSPRAQRGTYPESTHWKVMHPAHLGLPLHIARRSHHCSEISVTSRSGRSTCHGRAPTVILRGVSDRINFELTPAVTAGSTLTEFHVDSLYQGYKAARESGVSSCGPTSFLRGTSSFPAQESGS